MEQSNRDDRKRQGRRNKMTNMRTKFEFNEEDGREGGAGLPFKSCFYASDVCALIGPMSRNKDTGHNIVDRGHLLVQRELATDYLRIAVFDRDATSEHEEPALVVPVGFIALSHLDQVSGKTSKNGPPMGRIRLYTRCSINPKACMEPQVVTIYMGSKDMDRFNISLGAMMLKHPLQNLFFNHQQA